MALDRGPNATQLTTTPRGHKRILADEPDGEQRLSKRLDCLSLNSRGKRYVPVTADSRNLTKDVPTPSSTRPSKHDCMEIDNSKDRVYIHDLDEELAEVESDDEHPIFIPDIEKHLLKLPYSVLMNDVEKRRMENMQMVLYNVPSSLTIPEEQDNVRRAIIEARERARRKRSESADNSKPQTVNGTLNCSDDWEANDPDAMDES